VTSVNLVSKRYAKALFLAANKSKSLEEVSSSLSNLSRVFDDMPNEIQRVFLDPTVCRKDLTLCVSSFLKGLPAVFNNFCNILVNEGRLSLIGDVNIYFQKLLMHSKGQTTADVWSAYKLSNDFCLKLEKILSNLTDKKVSLNVQLDPRLLGGTVIEIDGFRLDNSILGNLEQLSYHMKGAR
jgi:F-type H+-transporting ATPase subunit delta